MGSWDVRIGKYLTVNKVFVDNYNQPLWTHVKSNFFVDNCNQRLGHSSRRTSKSANCSSGAGSYNRRTSKSENCSSGARSYNSLKSAFWRTTSNAGEWSEVQFQCPPKEREGDQSSVDPRYRSHSLFIQNLQPRSKGQRGLSVWYWDSLVVNHPDKQLQL